MDLYQEFQQANRAKQDFHTHEMIYAVISAARELLKDEKHWTKDLLARDKDGDKCSPYSDCAVQFCAIGACQRAYWDHYSHSPYSQFGNESELVNYVHNFCWDHYGYYLPDLNDLKGHAAVLKAFDDILAELKIKLGRE